MIASPARLSRAGQPGLMLLPALLLAAASWPVPPAERQDDPIARFAAVAATGTAEERRAALAELVATADPAAAEAVVTEYGRQSARLRLDRREAHHLGYALERRRAVLASWQALAGNDDEAARQVPREERAVRDLEADLAKLERRIGVAAPWCDALAEGLSTLCETIPPTRARRLLASLEEQTGEAPDLGRRLAGLELWARVGPPGTALEIRKRMGVWDKERGKLARKLPRLMAEVREVEARMQVEAERQGGAFGPGTKLLYDKAVAEANAVRRQVVELELLLEAGSRAGGLALGREPDDARPDVVRTLARQAAREKGRLRLATVSLLAAAPGEAVDHELLALLEDEDEPALVGEILDALVQRQAPGTEELLLERYLSDPHPHVRSRAAAGLAALRSRAAVGALIERLPAEEGRLRTDLGQALTSLTGQDFHGNETLWRRWWADHEDDFEVAPEPGPRAVEAAAPYGGVTFFGIHTDSQRVLFVVDVSGSMAFTTAPRPGVDENDARSRDQMMPRGDEISRLAVMKRDLTQALGGLRDGALFNLVLYASDVWTWSDDLAEMDAGTRGEVLEFLNELEPVGGTNLYGALSRALDLAGAGDGGDGRWSDPAVDTIYLLSDGRASVGVTTDPDEILEMVRQRNRTAGIVIHTIGLSDGHDAVLLRGLAEENGGTYVGR